MASKIITVLGATGNQGGSVVKVFTQIPGWTVRGITRSTSSPSAQKLRDQGVEPVAANIDDRSSLEKAFAGSHAIFAVTDFWQFPGLPEVQQEAKERNVKINVICAEREIKHGKNIADAASKVDTLERFVLSTASNAKKWTQGRILRNFHFDAKAAAWEYVKEEHPELAKKTSYLLVGAYLDGWKQSPAFKPQKQDDGSYAFHPVCEAPYPTIPFTHPPNDVGWFTKALVLTAPPGTVLLGANGRHTWHQLMEAWQNVTGKQARYEPTDFTTARQFMQGDIMEEFVQMFEYFNISGYDGGDPEVKLPQEVGVELDKIWSLEHYWKQQDQEAILK